MPVKTTLDFLRLQGDALWAGGEFTAKLLADPVLDQIAPRGDGATPVLTLPGFSGPEMSLRPLNRFLNRRGFVADSWGLGINRGPESMGLTLAAVGIFAITTRDSISPGSQQTLNAVGAAGGILVLLVGATLFMISAPWELLSANGLKVEIGGHTLLHAASRCNTRGRRPSNSRASRRYRPACRDRR